MKVGSQTRARAQNIVAMYCDRVPRLFVQQVEAVPAERGRPTHGVSAKYLYYVGGRIPNRCRCRHMRACEEKRRFRNVHKCVDNTL